MAKYQRLSKRSSSLYDKIYGSGVLESVTPSEPEEVKELEEARGGSKNLYQKIYGSKKTNEEVASEKKICPDCGESVVEGKCACKEDFEYDDEF